MKTTFAAVLLCAAVSPALAEKPDLSDPKVAKLLMERDGEIVRRPETCGFDQQAAAQFARDNYDPAARVDAPSALGEAQVVYLNKNGATYTFGAAGGITSSATNNIRANAFPSAGMAVIPALNTAQFDWPTIVQCVKNSFRPFGVIVTETEPTGVPYVEAVVGGSGGREVGRPDNDLFGIAATDTFCTLYRTGIAFNFAGTHVSAFPNATVRNQEMCNTIAHEVGHVLGLEHQILEPDHMSYVYIQDECPAAPAGCKSFVDQVSQCGVQPGQLNPCSCGPNPNSYAKLASMIGLRPTESVKPTLEIITPDDLTKLPPTFEIVADASDNMQMQDVALLIDGIQVAVDSTPNGTTYTLRATGIAEGMHTLVVRATDFALNTEEVTANVRIQLAQTGDSCVDSDACEGGLCAQSSEGSFCTEDCANSACPDDFTCTMISSGAEICVPDDNGGDGDGGGDGGGCCSTSSSSGSAAAGLLALGVGLVLSRRRRS
jgi:MYXO-CTERM domain-containing protein